MDWKSAAVQRLKDYEARKKAVQLLEEQLENLEAQFVTIRGARTDGDPVKGGGNCREDMLLSNIVMRDELTANKGIVEREITITEKGLAALTDEERRILEVFYISRPYNHILHLCDELSVEKSEVYRRKNAALDKFTIACYGVVKI
jgi:hypothetical protein